MPPGTGRYGALFSDSPGYAKFNGGGGGRGDHKSTVSGSGSLVDALNEASSTASGGNRSDCGDGVASSPLAVNGVTAGQHGK